jgi:hypothetical protein
LLATISSEQLQPLQLLTPSTPGGSFASNVESLLQPHIKPNEALYIVLRRYTSTPALVAVTYVPDTAPVRQKMLFAATRLTLVRELGSEHFRETLFATTAQELTPAGFEKHDAHTAMEAPLTEEERSLGEVRRAEQEAGMGTGTREIHLSKHMATPVAEPALEALKELAAGDGRSLVMLVRVVIRRKPYRSTDSCHRKSTPSPNLSSSSLTKQLPPQSRNWCRPFPLPSRASPSTGSRIRTTAARPALCCSFTRAPPTSAPRRSSSA